MSDGLNVVTIKAGDNGKQRVIDRLEELLAQAKQGEILGIIYGIEMEGSIAFGKANLTYPVALGILDRISYNMNKEWDGYNK